MMRRLKTVVVVLVTILLFLVFWPGSGRKWEEISINEGQNAGDAVRLLLEKGLIRSPYPFLIWIRIRGGAQKIQVGRYRFSQGRSAFWIVDDVIEGRVEKVRVVIPEGYASWQIAERLESQKICDGAAFKALVSSENLEGFLFPATYELANGLSPATAARKMTAEFDLRWTPEIDARAQELGLSKKQVVTLASIIEREVRMRDELPLVSAVYHNRLKKNMTLDADPTVQYALGFWKSRLTYADYRKVTSPYNTYLNFGLPPGPICSPGWDALKAALWPAASHALYFLATDDGHHVFSETYREHVNKINKRNREKRTQ